MAVISDTEYHPFVRVLTFPCMLFSCHNVTRISSTDLPNWNQNICSLTCSVGSEIQNICEMIKQTELQSGDKRLTCGRLIWSITDTDWAEIIRRCPFSAMWRRIWATSQFEWKEWLSQALMQQTETDCKSTSSQLRQALHTCWYDNRRSKEQLLFLEMSCCLKMWSQCNCF